MSMIYDIITIFSLIPQCINYYPKTTFNLVFMFYIEDDHKVDQGKQQHGLYVL